MKAILQESIFFFKKEWLVEARQKYVLGGMILYVTSTVFVIYFSLKYQNALSDLSQTLWSILFWITILFVSVNVTYQSLIREKEGRLLYYYTLLSPQAFILGKILLNSFITSVLAVLTCLIFTVVIGEAVDNYLIFFAAAVLGSVAYSTLFTLVTAIASKASNSSTLSVVLGFPLVIPLLIFIIKFTRESLTVETTKYFVNNLAILSAFNILLILLAVILFPYLWRN